MLKNDKIIGNIIFLTIPLICLFFSISYSIEQNSIDSALYLGNFINIPDEMSFAHLMKVNQFSLLIYLQAFLLKLGLSFIGVSQITLFFSILMNFIGIYLIIKSIINNVTNQAYVKIISFIFSYIAIFIIGLNLGMVDYAVVIFSEHTFGMYAASMPTFIFGLLANGNIFFAFFSAFILLCIHGVLGAWMIGILILTSIIYKFYYNESYFIKDAIIGFLIGLLLFIIFFSLHSYFTGSFKIIELSGFDLKTLNNWDVHWEAHRYRKEINYLYIFKSILLMVITILLIRFNKSDLNKNTSFAMVSIVLTIILGLTIYTLYKVFLESLPPFIKAPMPSRVFNSHSLIAWPIFFSYSIIIIKKISYRIKIQFNKLFLIFYVTLSLLIISFNTKNLLNYIFFHYDKEIGINSVLKNNPFRTNVATFILNSPFNDIFLKKKYIRGRGNFDFWKKINNYDTDSYWIASSPYHKDLIRYGRKPVLINSNSFDIVYMGGAKSLMIIKDIIENVYNIPFDKPPLLPLKTYYGRVPGALVKIEFEGKKYQDWLKISNKYNVNHVIVPSNWNIDLPIDFTNGKLTLYKIQ